MMKISVVSLALVGLLAGAGSSQAGCLTGAAAGGVAGHFAGHHPILGAVAGCAIGHHYAKKRMQQERMQQQDSNPNMQNGTGNQTNM